MNNNNCYCWFHISLFNKTYKFHPRPKKELTSLQKQQLEDWWAKWVDYREPKTADKTALGKLEKIILDMLQQDR